MHHWWCAEGGVGCNILCTTEAFPQPVNRTRTAEDSTVQSAATPTRSVRSDRPAPQRRQAASGGPAITGIWRSLTTFVDPLAQSSYLTMKCPYRSNRLASSLRRHSGIKSKGHNDVQTRDNCSPKYLRTAPPYLRRRLGPTRSWRILLARWRRRSSGIRDWGCHGRPDSRTGLLSCTYDAADCAKAVHVRQRHPRRQ